MAVRLRELVRSRAGGRCEYCHLHEDTVDATSFHIEHILAKQHGGTNDPGNLAWSCHTCNLHKGPNLSGVDPLTEQVVRLFNPRNQSWSRHFEWIGPALLGRTRVGRATIAVLAINAPKRVKMRQMMIDDGQGPEG